MTIAYREFDTTQANLVADLKTNILANTTDYTNPTGNVVQATTTRGATIAIDLSGYQISVTNLSPKPWRLFSAGVGTDAGPQKWLYWQQYNAGAAAQPLHCRTAAGKEFLYVDIEGPRAGEANADSTTKGSARTYFFIADVVPYLAADTTPTVCYGAAGQLAASSSAGTNNGTHVIHVGRNQANTTPWIPGKLWTLRAACSPGEWGGLNYQPYAADGNQYCFPYVVMEDAAGLRGRLNGIMYCGQNSQAEQYDTVAPGMSGGTFTFNGNTYKTITPSKGSGQGNNRQSWGALGEAQTDTNGLQITSPLIAVAIA